MGASSCRAAVRLDDGSEVSEVWPAGQRRTGASRRGRPGGPRPPDGVDVGRLVLELRQQAAPSASRRRVLREFCERAGPAFATTGLEESLRAGATRLARVNADLAASRQRLLAADDSGRRQVAAAIRVGVVSGLREVPDRLSAVEVATADGASDPAAAVGLVDACIATTAEALDELREITRAISPPMLAQRGLPAALRARGGRVHVDDGAGAQRWPAGRGGRRLVLLHGAPAGGTGRRPGRARVGPGRPGGDADLRGGRRPRRRAAGGCGRPRRGARRDARPAGAGRPADVPGSGARRGRAAPCRCPRPSEAPGSRRLAFGR